MQRCIYPRYPDINAVITLLLAKVLGLLNAQNGDKRASGCGLLLG